MADHTLAGIIGIVAVVLVSAIFFSTPTSLGEPAQSQNEVSNAAGAATTGSASNGRVCLENRFCSGSKLIIVNDDCSISEARCQYGCDAVTAQCR